jgi:hypothetical protein
LNVSAQPQAVPAARAATRSAAWRARAGLAVLCLWFIASGWPFMRRLGIEVDEALVGNGIYERAAPVYSWRLFGHEIPVMLMSYVGSMKAWIYNGIFLVTPPGPLALRLPMMLAGAASIWLFFRLLDDLHGRRAAWTGAALLATDTTFVLTDAIDFGPAALQHLFLLGGLVCLLHFHRGRGEWLLAAASFLFGLGLWDKALFAWLLTGVACGALFAFPRALWMHARSRRTVAMAAAAFAAGAFPLIQFNIARPFETVRANASAGADDALHKAIYIRPTVGGSGMLGFLTAPDPGPKPGSAHHLVQRISFAAARFFGRVQNNWILETLIAASLLAPLWRRTAARGPVLFSAVFLVVVWFEMALTNGAGASVHHIVLLWPFHLAIIAFVLAELSKRLRGSGVMVLTAVVVLLAARNVLVTNTNLVELIRNGGSVRWSEAFPALIEYLRHSDAERVWVGDWGILETVNLLTEGSSPVQDATGVIRSLDSSAGADEMLRMISQRRAVFLRHAAGAELWPGMNDRTDCFAQERGFNVEPLKIIQDRNGRSIFELIRYRRDG